MRRTTILASAALVAAMLTAIGCIWSWRHRSDVLILPGVVEIQEVRLGSKIGGRVAEVAVAEGDLVKPEQVLVRFEAPELEAQREQWQARLRVAEAELERARNGPRTEEKEAAKAAWDAAQARLKRLKTGWRQEEIRQIRSDFESAEADLKLARDEFERIEKLHRQGSVARSEYDTARANRDRSLGRSAAARAKLDMLLTGSREEDIAEGAAEVARAKANYDLLLAGTRSEDLSAADARVAELRGRLRELEANLEEATVRAPRPAIVEVLAVRKGDLVMPNQPIIRVLAAEDLWVKVYVPETVLGKVRLGQSAEVTIDSYPGRKFMGTVTQIASISEFTPRNVQSADERRHQVFAVKVYVDDPQGIFKSGIAAEVTLPVAE